MMTPAPKSEPPDSGAAGPGPSLRALAWHRPLLGVAFAMAVLAVVAVVGFIVDPRVIGGAPIWEKPLKFAISICVYSLTLSWLIGLVKRRQRFAWWAGTVAAVFLLVEVMAIVGAAIVGATSHFNVSTPFHAAMWSVMAVSIVIVWIAALVVAAMLFRHDLGDGARSLAVRAGFVIALVGMALAFLMTGPTAEQLSDFHGIAGAHAVGVPDGGPGLPLVGWSTVAGDLRVPHFIGMHALQIIPIAAIGLEWLARRITVLRRPTTRRGIIRIIVILYVGVLALTTGQALSGESIVRPSPLVAAVTLGLVVGAAAAFAVLVVVAGRADRAMSRPTPDRGTKP